jgi:hypothetical protein
METGVVDHVVQKKLGSMKVKQKGINLNENATTIQVLIKFFFFFKKKRRSSLFHPQTLQHRQEKPSLGSLLSVASGHVNRLEVE